MTRRSRQLFLLYFCSLLIPSFSSPLNSHGTYPTDDVAIAGPSSLPDEKGHTAGVMVSWLWGLVWGDDSTVTVVDRTPVLNFNARPAAFGPSSDVLGYMIRVEDFSVPCVDEEDGVEYHGHNPLWSNVGSEWEAGHPAEYEEADISEGRRRPGVNNSAEHEWPLEARQGCPRLCVRGGKKPESSETWIALVMRGQCTFVDKVREVQRFGAKGVVVGGETEAQDQHGDGLVQMFSLGDSSDISIPSTYITHQSYMILSALIGSSNTSTWGLPTVSVGITTDPSGWEWYSPLLTFLILLFFPSSLTLCTLLVHRVRAARAARRERAPEDVVLNLPWRVWEGQETLLELEKTFGGANALSGHEDGKSSAPQQDAVAAATREDVPDRDGTVIDAEPSTSDSRNTADIQTPLAEAARKWYEMQVECAICLEDFVKGDKVRVLPCRHIFHMEEVDDWLIRRKKLCPICKHDVTRPHYPDSESDIATQQAQQSIFGDRDPSDNTIFPSSYDEDEEPGQPTENTPLLQRHG